VLKRRSAPIKFVTLLAVLVSLHSRADDLAVRAQAVIDAAVDQHGLPGVTAGISRGGEVIWVGAAGFMDVENQVPAVPEMVHRIASISKAMTATAAMQLVEAGKLKIDAPLRSCVPTWPQNPEGEILIWHVLSHTSGIKHYERRENSTTEHYATLLDAVEIFKDRPLAFAPGTSYNYTTYGYTALGAAIETASGETFNDYMRAHIWAPAGMDHTSLEVRGATVANKSKLYRRSSSGPVPDRDDDNSVKYPGGGIQSTAADLLRFAIAFDAAKLVSQQTIDRMLQVPQLTVPPKAPLDYGFGWIVGNSEDFGRFIRHDGGQSGTSTNLLLLRDSDIAVSVLCNLYNAPGPVGEITWSLAALASGREPASASTN
jgi:CubicO group peptidase (beta-lactamase class C family)